MEDIEHSEGTFAHMALVAGIVLGFACGFFTHVLLTLPHGQIDKNAAATTTVPVAGAPSQVL